MVRVISWPLTMPVPRGRLLVACVFVGVLTASISSVGAQSEYRMLVNNGAGWVDGGGFGTLVECNREAAIHAAKYSVQAGCTTTRAAMEFQRQQALAAESQRAEIAFQQAAQDCAGRSWVRIINKPGGRVTILGTTEQRFAFEECMVEKGQPTR